jgi:hypothetical protein
MTSVYVDGQISTQAQYIRRNLKRLWDLYSYCFTYFFSLRSESNSSVPDLKYIIDSHRIENRLFVNNRLALSVIFVLSYCTSEVWFPCCWRASRAKERDRVTRSDSTSWLKCVE